MLFRTNDSFLTMSEKFETYTKNLQEMSQLTRISLCFQFLTLMNLCDQDLDKGKVERNRDDEGKVKLNLKGLHCIYQL